MTPSPAAPAEGIDRAVELLARARAPFVYGLAQSPVGTARLAARLAQRLDAALDVEGGDRLAPEIEAITATGQVTATFGEMRAAADCVVLWRSDPERDGLFPAGTGPGTRRFIVIPPAPESDGMPVPASEQGDFEVPVPAGCDLEALQWLRFFLRGGSPATDSPLTAGDRAWTKGLLDAARLVLESRRMVLLWDPALVAHPYEMAAGFALLTLEPRPPSHPRMAVKAIGERGHVAGAVAGLLAATGVPRAIAFRGGRATGDPLRFGAGRMFSGGADLVVAIEPSSAPPAPLTVPLVLIASRRPPGWPEPDVFLPIAPPRESGDGLWLAADGVPEPATHRPPPSNGTGTETETGVLTALLERLRPAARVR
jgi:hypothetical protein